VKFEHVGDPNPPANIQNESGFVLKKNPLNCMNRSKKVQTERIADIAPYYRLSFGKKAALDILL
jgi:hypothetical protein